MPNEPKMGQTQTGEKFLHFCINRIYLATFVQFFANIITMSRLVLESQQSPHESLKNHNNHLENHSRTFQELLENH